MNLPGNQQKFPYRCMLFPSEKKRHNLLYFQAFYVKTFFYKCSKYRYTFKMSICFNGIFVEHAPSAVDTIEKRTKNSNRTQKACIFRL